jgi:hypothetical protein
MEKIINYFKELQTYESPQITRNSLINLLFLFGSTHLVFLFGIILTSAISFAIGQSITIIPVIFGAILAYLYCIFGSRVYFPKYFIVGQLVFLIAFFLFVDSCLIAGKFYDLSYDGQSYHQDIIDHLAIGWNPFYQHLTPNDLPTAGILNYYPKTAEVYETSLYKLTNQIEYSKTFNIVLAYVAFILILALLLSIKRINNIVAVVVSFLTLLDPVSLTQAFSFYIDGQVYQLLLCLIAISGLIYYEKKSFLLIPLFCLISLLISIKVTAFAYAIVFIGILFLFGWYSEKIHFSTRIFLVAASSAILAFLFIGFNPFITNTFYYGHPLYPAMGKRSLDYVQINGPENFYNKPSIYLLFYSIFSESDFLKGDGKFAHLKVPLTVTPREIEAFTSTDPIEGGFGPFFSGAIILTLMILIYASIYKRNNFTKLCVLFSVIVLATCLLNAASFYAMFIPQLWMIPCLAVLLGFSLRSYFTNLLAALLCMIILINTAFIIQVNWGYNIQNSEMLRQELNHLSVASQRQPLIVNFGLFTSNSVRFREAGIQFTEEKHDLTCPEPARLLGRIITESKIVACSTPYI